VAGCTGGIPPVSCRQTTDVERERSGTLSQVDTGISSIRNYCRYRSRVYVEGRIPLPRKRAIFSEILAK